MKATAITLLAFTVAPQAQAQPVELTLNCLYEWEVVNDQRIKSSSSFSAVVRMQTNGNAVIETNDLVCEHFAGSFNEVKVSAECDLTIDILPPRILHRQLEIDRIDGAFRLELEVHVDTEPRKELPFYLYYGHCKPGSKLF